eukprot:202026-Hanusia_phi.AAC.5
MAGTDYRASAEMYIEEMLPKHYAEKNRAAAMRKSKKGFVSKLRSKTSTKGEVIFESVEYQGTDMLHESSELARGAGPCMSKTIGSCTCFGGCCRVQ